MPMLFSPNKGHCLVPLHPVPTLILDNGKQSAIVESFHPDSKLMYNDVSLETQMSCGVAIPTMDCSKFFGSSIEEKFDTVNILNDSVKTLE